jgi:hypothetical protein
MTSDKLEDIRKALHDAKRCGATWFKLHVRDAEELVASVWPERPSPRVKWTRARVPAPTRQVDG